MATFTIIILEAPYAKERALTALRFAWTADLEGHKVRIWLFENGVYLAPSAYEAGFFSSAHTDEVVEETLQAARAAFQALH